MRFATPLLLLVAALAAASSAVVGPGVAQAAKKAYEDKRLGYRLKIDDDFLQNPPKLTGDEAFIVGDWYNDAPKYDAPGLRPTFQVTWFAEPKAPPAGTAATPADGGAPGDDGALPSREDLKRQFREQFRVQSFDEYLDRMFEYNTRLFGEAVPMKDRWATAQKDRTAAKVEFEWFEINPPTRKKKDGAADGYCYVARLTLDRPEETIHVGFWGSCATGYAKSRFQKEFAQVVKSFEELRSATDSRNETTQADLSSDPEKRREQIRKTKLVAGWKSTDTKNYIMIYSDEVDPRLAKSIGEQIEAIRAQVYEVIFPPDRPITAVCIIRVCKDRDQYLSYGAPPSSAGYWSPSEEELVFYEEQSNKKDSIRVLYHEAFHQYIHYSVGEFAPHPWFNEGHGDYFAGFNYEAGKFVRDTFKERTTLAKETKRNPKRPPLKEWLRWDQRQYYGGNKQGLSGLEDYALGWSFIYFLRTTKKEEYQGILERYFDAMKATLTRERAMDEAFNKAYADWQKKVKDDPSLPPPERQKDEYHGDPLENALTAAFKGVDLDKLERDWLAADE